VYDYLIVGAGLYGATFARLITDAGKSCIVVEKRSDVAGNAYTERREGIDVHMHGPHIFHTNNEEIWRFVNKFATFNSFVNRPKVFYKQKIYSFPINLFTLYQLWGVTNPEQAGQKLEQVRVKVDSPKNFEEAALDAVGSEIYEIFFKGYTSKQWMESPKNLPASLFRRLPIRLTFEDNYFTDKYQGIPNDGYTKMVANILHGIPVIKSTNYCLAPQELNRIAKKVVYTGKIDELFEYRFGALPYRGLNFEYISIPTQDFKGTP
jgi:UDP-galactopyranose mutase